MKSIDVLEGRILELLFERDGCAFALDQATTRLDAALREIRELHGEATQLRAQLTAVLELDGDVFTANARLGGCQQRVAELEAELAGCNTARPWPGANR